MSATFEAAVEGVGDDRRTFLKKLVVGTAFAGPVVASFTMTDIKAVFAQTPSISGAVGAGTVTTTQPANQTTTSTTTTTLPRNQTTTTTEVPK